MPLQKNWNLSIKLQDDIIEHLFIKYSVISSRLKHDSVHKNKTKAAKLIERFKRSLNYF